VADKETKQVELIVTPKVDEKAMANTERKLKKLDKKQIFSYVERPFDAQYNSLSRLRKMSNYKSFEPSYMKLWRENYRKERRAYVRNKISENKISYLESIAGLEAKKRIESIGAPNIAEQYLLNKKYTKSNMFNKNKNGFYTRKLDKTIYDRLSDRVKSFFAGGNKPYDNAPFRKLMMYLGSAMLLQYAVMMAGTAIKSVLTTVADTEVESLKGTAYRNRLADTTKFDKATKRYSELSGMADFSSRAKFADFYGRLQNLGINTQSLDPDTLVKVMRGIEFMTGETPEQVDKKLLSLLSGKGTKEETKEFGITSKNNPVQILNDIYETLKKNTSASVGMEKMLLRDRLKAISERPREMFNRLHSNYSFVFDTISKNFDKFIKGIFGGDNREIQGRWNVFFNTIREFTDEVLTEENSQLFAKYIITPMGRVVATGTAFAKSMRDLNDKTDGALGKIAEFVVKIGIWSTALSSALWAISLPIRGVISLAERLHLKEILDFGKSSFSGIKDNATNMFNAGKQYATNAWNTGKYLVSSIPYYVANAGTKASNFIGNHIGSAGVGAGLLLHSVPAGAPDLNDANNMFSDFNYTAIPSGNSNTTNGTYINAQNVYLNNGDFTTDTLINGSGY
jgi:hypothetical protein